MCQLFCFYSTDVYAEFMIDSYVGTSEALTSGPFIIQALATAVGAPIVEELMFRGVIYRRLRRMAE